MTEACDHSSYDEFTAYYTEKSVRPEQLRHFASVRDAILRVLNKGAGPNTTRPYDMLDVGCNAGGQCGVWATSGHRVHGLDINEPLLELARKRASESGQEIDYRLGTATDLPWPDVSMDICIALELLEHVAEWERCLDEMARVVRPAGIVFVSTTNMLCPIQQEFTLPVYSWYPNSVKRYFERLATTTHPEFANHAKYPAVNWFTPYRLRAEFARRGFDSFDRFDLVDVDNKGKLATKTIASIKTLPLLRFLAHVCTSGTTMLGVKR
jgi:2-polyprenyl-6-hydroxyphenyl methylase/3-demethylubiquinone-9 3-methyltransferase